MKQRNIMLKAIPMLVVGLGLTTNVIAQEAVLETEEQKFNYTLGVQIGAQIKSGLMRDGLEVDPAIFARGIKDVIAGGEMALKPEEMQALMQARQEKRQQELAAVASAATQRGAAYMEENKAKEGVTTTESGLQYKVLTEGTGDKPGAEDTVVVHYKGMLIDGTEFDSSYQRGEPATFSLNGIIKGWQEALTLMNVGSKWEVVIPPELAYGERGAGGNIGPNETLVFEIELVEVK